MFANPLDRGEGGDGSTRWSTGTAQANGQWLQADLGAVVAFNQIQLDSGESYANDYPRGYAVQVSKDGLNWTQVATGQGFHRQVPINFPSAKSSLAGSASSTPVVSGRSGKSLRSSASVVRMSPASRSEISKAKRSIRKPTGVKQPFLGRSNLVQPLGAFVHVLKTCTKAPISVIFRYPHLKEYSFS